MAYSFNLIDQGWIPCIDLDGRVEELGIQAALLRAHQLRAVQGDSPLETAAIYRLLLAVLHSALRGPRSQAEWGQWWQAGRWEESQIGPYLQRWRERFDLFHPSAPFYQADDSRVKAPKPINVLAADMVSGNMAVLFDHHTDAAGESLSAARAGRVLLVAQTFGLGGLSGLGGDSPFTDGPWGRGVIFLVEGDTLFETLALNLLRCPDDAVFPAGDDDAPAWERGDPHAPARDVPQGYLDYLTWQSRRILLIPTGSPQAPSVAEMKQAPGLRLAANLYDPMKLYRPSKDGGYLVTRYSEERALWRDSATLLKLTNPRGRPPHALNWLAALARSGYIPHHQVYRCMALGMANDQAKIEFFREEHLPLLLDYLEDDALVEKLAAALERAEQTGQALNTAVRWLAVLVIAPGDDGKQWREVNKVTKDQAGGLAQHWNADRLFWQKLELPFVTLLQDLPTHPAAPEEWQAALRRTAWEALEHAAAQAGDGAAALKAAVRARALLAGMLNQMDPNHSGQTARQPTLINGDSL